MPARRLVMVLFAVIWLPAGAYLSLAYMDVRYVPPVFFDELEAFGGQAAADAEKTLDGRVPDSSVTFEWRHVPGAIEGVIDVDARCPDLTVVSQSALAVPYVGVRQTSGKYVTTVWSVGRDEHGAILCPDSSRHAARRGVRAEAVGTTVSSVDLGDVLLSQVLDTESDLLAMSAHGHTYAQEN